MYIIIINIIFYTQTHIYLYMCQRFNIDYLLPSSVTHDDVQWAAHLAQSCSEPSHWNCSFLHNSRKKTFHLLSCVHAFNIAASRHTEWFV